MRAAVDPDELSFLLYEAVSRLGVLWCNIYQGDAVSSICTIVVNVVALYRYHGNCLFIPGFYTTLCVRVSGEGPAGDVAFVYLHTSSTWKVHILRHALAIGTSVFVAFYEKHGPIQMSVHRTASDE